MIFPDRPSGSLSRTPLRAAASSPLMGTALVPGDKSISHRALIIGGVARGRTRIEGLLEAEDIMATAAAMRAIGAQIAPSPDGAWEIDGTGVGALLDPPETLDFGNAGTGVRLIMGLIAGHGLTARLTGDASLRSRPMGRILSPLGEIGARVIDGGPEHLPLTLRGPADPLPVTYRLPVPSAQVKSAVLLAGLNAPGVTTVIEPEATRDHTERMLAYFGASLVMAEEPDGGQRVSLTGRPDLIGRDVVVPGDPSSAAFPLIAAALVPGSRVTVAQVMINPTRAGLIGTLREMGARLTLTNRRELGGEPVADIEVEAGPLEGVEVPAERAPSMIDEYPVLAVAASFARGTTIMRGLAELRVKESDRLAAVVAGLAANGVKATVTDDDLIVEGGDGAVAGGGVVETFLDHRIAMSFLVMGLATRRPVVIDDATMIATSFPDFEVLMRGLGGALEPAA